MLPGKIIRVNRISHPDWVKFYVDPNGRIKLRAKQKCEILSATNALYIPTFKQNIFLVQAATKNGAHISFERDNCQLIYPNGAVFNITQWGRLYYLKNIVSVGNATYDLHTWHKILGYSNETDIKKLPDLVKGMKIKPPPNYALNCEIQRGRVVTLVPRYIVGK